MRCFDSNAQALRLLGDPFPITLAQEQDVIRRAARATELCARNGGPLLSHMSTANVARDLDLLRQAVGEEQMNLFGISYGSFVGEVYANLFGERVRAMALDGILDPVEWTTGRTPAEAAAPYEYRVGSYLGANQALEAFLDACQAAPSCFFRDPQLDLREKYDRLLERVRRRPVNVSLPNGRQVRLTYQVLVEGSNDALLRQDNSLGLGFVLQQGWEATEGPATPPPPAEPVQEEPLPRPGARQGRRLRRHREPVEPVGRPALRAPRRPPGRPVRLLLGLQVAALRDLAGHGRGPLHRPVGPPDGQPDPADRQPRRRPVDARTRTPSRPPASWPTRGCSRSTRSATSPTARSPTGSAPASTQRSTTT